MFALVWDERGDVWNWRRRLFAWEDELVVDCRALLNNVTLQVSSGN